MISTFAVFVHSIELRLVGFQILHRRLLYVNDCLHLGKFSDVSQDDEDGRS